MDGVQSAGMWDRLLARLLPQIYADPNAPRPCFMCGKPVPVAELVSGRFCSEECADENWISTTS